MNNMMMADGGGGGGVYVPTSSNGKTPINPNAIPGKEIDPDTVASQATQITAAGVAVRDNGASILSTWQGLSAHYTAPEQATVLGLMDPVGSETTIAGDDLTVIGEALAGYAEDVRPIKRELDVLRGLATDFIYGPVYNGVQVTRLNPAWTSAHMYGSYSGTSYAYSPGAGTQAKTDRDDIPKYRQERVEWHEDQATVDYNNSLIDRVNAEQVKLWDVERRWANKIRALWGGEALRAFQSEDDKNGYGLEEIPEGTEMPWGAPTERSEGCAEATINNVFVDFLWEGVIVGGVWGTITGLGTLVLGYNPATGEFFSGEAYGMAWSNLGMLAAGLVMNATLIGPAIALGGVIEQATGADIVPDGVQDFYNGANETLLETGKALIAYDKWAEDGWTAAGETVFNLGTILIPGGAAISGIKGAGTAASVLGKMARVVDFVDPGALVMNGALKVGGISLDALKGALTGMGRLDGLDGLGGTLKELDGGFKGFDDALSGMDGGLKNLEGGSGGAGAFDAGAKDYYAGTDVASALDGLDRMGVDPNTVSFGRTADGAPTVEFPGGTIELPKNALDDLPGLQGATTGADELVGAGVKAGPESAAGSATPSNPHTSTSGPADDLSGPRGPADDGPANTGPGNTGPANDGPANLAGDNAPSGAGTNAAHTTTAPDGVAHPAVDGPQTGTQTPTGGAAHLAGDGPTGGSTGSHAAGESGSGAAHPAGEQPGGGRVGDDGPAAGHTGTPEQPLSGPEHRGDPLDAAYNQPRADSGVLADQYAPPIKDVDGTPTIDTSEMSPGLAELVKDPEAPFGRDPETTKPFTRAEWESRYMDGDNRPVYPGNDGAVPGTRVEFTDPQSYFAEHGPTLDRIGGDGGTFFGETGASFESRGLPGSNLNQPYSVYRLADEWPPNMRVEVSEIAPAFGQPGGGTQFRVMMEVDGTWIDVPAKQLLDDGIITPRDGGAAVAAPDAHTPTPHGGDLGDAPRTDDGVVRTPDDAAATQTTTRAGEDGSSYTVEDGARMSDVPNPRVDIVDGAQRLVDQPRIHGEVSYATVPAPTPAHILELPEVRALLDGDPPVLRHQNGVLELAGDPQVVTMRRIQAAHDMPEVLRQARLQEMGLGRASIEDVLHNVDRFRGDIPGEPAGRIGRTEQSGYAAQVRGTHDAPFGDGHVLHGPDQVAGGDALNFDGVGDGRVNSSLGRQWRDQVDGLVRNLDAVADRLPEHILRYVHPRVEIRIVDTVA